MADISLLPDGISSLVAFLLITTSFFTSAMTAAFGIGGGLALISIMGVFLPVSALIPVHGLVQLGSNSGRAWRMRHHIQWPIILPFLIGAIIGAIVGASIVVTLPNALLKIVLGIFVIFVTWFSIPKMLTTGTVATLIGGFITTALTMFLGATGPLVIAIFAKAFDERKQLVSNTAVAMTAQHGFKTIAFGLFGFAFAAWLPLICAMVIFGYGGTIAGGYLLGKLNEALFRKIFNICLTLLALNMIRIGFATL